MSLDFKDLEDAEAFQRAFVLPLVEAVRKEVAPLVLSDAEQTKRIAALERNQGRALLGMIVYATGLGFVLDYVKKKLGL